VERPRRVLAIGLLLAALGWAADTQTKVVSDVTQLVPQNLQALKDVKQLEQATGVSGELDVMVHAKDLTDPSTVKWMTAFEQRVLAAHGYKSGDRCSQAKNPPQLCPALSLPDLFSASGESITRANIQSLLSSVPAYFSQGVISRDRTVANMAFGIRLMPLDKQKKLIDDIRSKLHPPPGVSANVVGLPVLAADANSQLSSTGRRALMLLAGLAAVFLVLLAIRRRPREAAVPLIPIAFATGWSALVLFLLRIPLNPMSAALGALVIAISTEFSVLLSERYRQHRLLQGLDGVGGVLQRPLRRERGAGGGQRPLHHRMRVLVLSGAEVDADETGHRALAASRARRYSFTTISVSSSTDVSPVGLSSVITPSWIRLTRSQLVSTWT